MHARSSRLGIPKRFTTFESHPQNEQWAISLYLFSAQWKTDKWRKFPRLLTSSEGISRAGCKESEHHLNASPAWLSWSVRPDTAESLTRPNQDQDPHKRSVSSVSVWLDRETNRNRLTRRPGLIRESEHWKSPGSSVLEKVKFPSPKQSTAEQWGNEVLLSSEVIYKVQK